LQSHLISTIVFIYMKPDQLSAIPFVNLRTFSHFSMLLAVGTVKDHLKAAKSLGHAGIALTDNASMAGCIQLFNLSKETGLPCILGVNLFVTEDIDTKDPDHKYERLIVFAKNWKGYQNLARLVSISSLEDHVYYRPRISYKELFDHKEGLIVSTSDIASPWGYAVLNNTGREVELLETFKSEFGEDLYVEISLADQSQRWNKDLKAFIKEDDKQETVNKRMLELSKTHGVTSYLTMPSYMPNRDKFVIQKIAISNSPLGRDGWHFHEAQYTMSVAELYERKQTIAPYISDDEFKVLCENSVLVLEKAKGFQPEFKPLLLKINYADHPVNQDAELERKLVLMEKFFEKTDPEFTELLQVSRENKRLQKTVELFPELASKINPMIKDDALRTVIKIAFANKKINFQNEIYRKRFTWELQVIQRNGVVPFGDYFCLLRTWFSFID
jgi:DNA polymerase-3 subunit alpha